MEFSDTVQNNNVEASVTNPKLLSVIASLLELDPVLLENALVKRKMTIKGQDLIIPLKGVEVRLF